ncbi:50S ribosome-binding GTPase [Candidatus Pacearchaeota archaeon]|nr:50S ribosome-binding GTPase [Candidatus Pacearchaeota archaeon]
MTKQREKFPALLLKIVDTSDIVLQILDARYIEEMRNLVMEDIIKEKGKKILYVFNKSDLVDINKAKKNPALKCLRPYVFTSATKRIGGKELRDKIKYMAKLVKKDIDSKYNRIQVGVIGYPNAGKSSIINLLVGKTSAATGAMAGFTRGIQKLSLTKNILLLDSPGVIPDRTYSQGDIAKTSLHVKVGARDWHRVKEPDMIVFSIFNDYKDAFRKFYKLKKTENAENLIEKIGVERNVLKKGGVVDTDGAARLILKDWQDNKIKI